MSIFQCLSLQHEKWGELLRDKTTSLAQGRITEQIMSPATALEWECSKLWCVEVWFYRSCRTIAKNIVFSSLWVVLVVRQCRISSFSCSGFSFAEECVSLCVVHADSFSIQLRISCKCEYVSLFSVYPNSDKHVTDHRQFQQLQLVLFFASLWIKNIIIIIDQLRQIFF